MKIVPEGKLKLAGAAMSRGFTIVELLTVIIAIGIIASITVVSYNGVQNRANDAAVQSDLSNIAKRIQVFFAANDRFPKGYSDFMSADVRVTKTAYNRGYNNGSSWYNLVYCWPNTANPAQFAIIAQSKSGAVFQYYNSKVSQVAYALSGSATTCSAAGVNISTSGRDWFYDADAWQGFAKS